MTVFTGVRAISILVDDQDAALAFYVDTLGFTLLADSKIPTGRWIELSPADGSVIVTLDLATPEVTRGAIMIRFLTDDAAAAHKELSAKGVHTGGIIEWPGVPPMFEFHDPDGNAFSITES
ncbi:VOC family protein [Antrihabitans cavernicola]|uniref:Glyoxalase n=1 Tax=Antrihabitans cavernicola TaxID=2495913 RepID=A0A5A7S2Y0_9NOCA|nr:VOC family protein [Spelaeibacter cavernicola]KAA0018521.1 glyoxalase [Spelaeibacter cavernicola]